MRPELAVEHRAHLDVLRGILGACIVGLARDNDVFDGVPQAGDDGELEVRVHEGRSVVLPTAPDGESVQARWGTIGLTEPFTGADGSTCAWERVDLLTLESSSKFADAPILTIEPVVDTWKAQAAQVLRGWILRTPVGVLSPT